MKAQIEAAKAQKEAAEAQKEAAEAERKSQENRNRLTKLQILTSLLTFFQLPLEQRDEFQSRLLPLLKRLLDEVEGKF